MTLSAWLTALVLAGVALSGCGSKSTTAPPGDTGGVHLLAFASDRGQAPGQFDIYLYDLDSQGFRVLRSINSTSPDRHPTISSDGSLIAFESDRVGAGDIYVYDRSTEKIFSPPIGVNTAAAETEPVFTDNALRIAFTRQVAGLRRIFMVDAVGDTLVSLPGLDTTGVAYSDWAPAPNIDGSVIAFVSDRLGTADVFVWQRGIGVRDLPLLRSDSLDIEPSLSGDGKFLFFASNRMGGQGRLDVLLYDVEANTLTNPVTTWNTSADERNPTASRHGNIFAFESDRAGGKGKYDTWNVDITVGLPWQGSEQSSSADDMQPSLRAR